MKRKAIVAILALTSISPVAQANEVARIQSAPGQSQSAWNASSQYQSFQCPAGTLRGEGVDMNYTTDRSDDYYFAYCFEAPAPAPVITPTPTPTSSPTVSETSTATVQTPSSTTASSSGSTSTAPATTTRTESTTATAAFDYQAFFQMFIAWFQTWFAQFLAAWGR